LAGILRGDIYWANLNPVRGSEQGGRRPVVILSHDVFNERSGTVIALAVTSRTQRIGYPLTYPLPERATGRPAWIKISQIRTLATERLEGYLGRVDEQTLRDVVRGLNQLIG
jgi:mRNA interferase MazF